MEKKTALNNVSVKDITTAETCVLKVALDVIRAELVRRRIKVY